MDRTFSNLRVAVVGLGVSGLSAVRLLCREGAEVVAIDRRSEEGLAPALRSLSGLDVRFVFNASDLSRFPWEVDRVVVSPGVPLGRLPLDLFRARGIEVIGEMELACRFVGAPILAITGTNGKSTTTTLVGEMLRSCGRKTFVGGNLGTPLSEAILSGERWDFIVVEASSFQLESIVTFRPRIAALLNVTPDHLDRYPGFSEYRRTKERIFENQQSGDTALLNAEDPALEGLLDRLRSQRVLFSRRGRPSKQGTKMNQAVFVEDDQIVSILDGRDEAILSIGELRLAGAHNLENALAATAVALLCRSPLEEIRKVLRTFSGLEHRMEFVREINGVFYFNDSKGTNVGALSKSLEGVASTAILIAGGRDKGGDFLPAREIIKQKVRRAILIGEAREKIRSAWSGATEVLLADSLKEAVFLAASSAKKGETVLLSPGCASFDQFLNFEDRGQQFKRLVRGL